MNIEYEATFADIDRDKMRSKLKELGATLVKEDFLQKRYNFDSPKCCTLDNAWVRVRDEDEKVTMALKSIPGGNNIENQKEIELIVSSIEDARDFLSNLGLKENSYQESRREKWDLDGVEVAIDEWPWLEPFIEIEGVSEQAVRRVSDFLEFDWSDAIFDSVDEQYKRKYSVEKEIVNNKTPRFVFGEPNPFA